MPAYAMQARELNGRFPYVATGGGPPLIVLPGLSRDSEIRDAKAYRPLAAVTQRTVYVVARPRELRRGITMRALAAIHAAALQEQFGRQLDVLGISTGGAIALQLAVDYPDLVGRLVVVAAASWLGDAGRAKLREYGKRIENGLSGAGILASVLAPPWLRFPAMLAIRLEEFSQRHIDPANMLATIDAECDFDVRNRLGEIKAHTLVIGGSRDRAFSTELFRSTAAGILGARLILYPGRGHVGTMLDPRFGRDVAAFLGGQA